MNDSPPNSKWNFMILFLSILKSIFYIASTNHIHKLTSYYLLPSTLNRRKYHVLKYLLTLGTFGLISVIGRGALELIFEDKCLMGMIWLNHVLEKKDIRMLASKIPQKNASQMENDDGSPPTRENLFNMDPDREGMHGHSHFDTLATRKNRSKKAEEIPTRNISLINPDDILRRQFDTQGVGQRNEHNKWKIEAMHLNAQVASKTGSSREGHHSIEEEAMTASDISHDSHCNYVHRHERYGQRLGNPLKNSNRIYEPLTKLWRKFWNFSPIVDSNSLTIQRAVHPLSARNQLSRNNPQVFNDLLSQKVPRTGLYTKRMFLQSMILTDRLETQYELHFLSKIVDACLHLLYFNYKLKNLSGMSILEPLFIAVYSLLTSFILHFSIPRIGKRIKDLRSEFLGIEDAIKHYLQSDSQMFNAQRDKKYWNQLISRTRKVTVAWQLQSWFYNLLNSLFMKYYVHTIMALCAGLPVFFGSLRKYQHSHNRSKFVSDLQFISFLVPLLINKWGVLFENISLHWKLKDEIAISQKENSRFVEGIKSNLFLSPIHVPTKKSSRSSNTQSSIVCQNVDIINPHTRRRILKNLSCTFREGGQHTLVLGPSECGKTTLFQTIYGLLPYNGTILKPSSPVETTHKSIYYVSKSIYVIDGKTWKEQLVWPDDICEYNDTYFSQIYNNDPLLCSLFNSYQLDCIKTWTTELSHTEKQRLALCRVKYHRPKYVIFDNNALETFSNEEEAALYSLMKKEKISIIRSISTHSALVDIHLYEMHDALLHLNGESGWKFSKIIKGQDGYTCLELYNCAFSS